MRAATAAGQFPQNISQIPNPRSMPKAHFFPRQIMNIQKRWVLTSVVLMVVKCSERLVNVSG